MQINLDGQYAFRINPDFTVQGLKRGQPLQIDNFGLAAAHQICELVNRIEELEQELNKK